jgi:hypothetical protein
MTRDPRPDLRIGIDGRQRSRQLGIEGGQEVERLDPDRPTRPFETKLDRLPSRAVIEDVDGVDHAGHDRRAVSGIQLQGATGHGCQLVWVPSQLGRGSPSAQRRCDRALHGHRRVRIDAHDPRSARVGRIAKVDLEPLRAYPPGRICDPVAIGPEKALDQLADVSVAQDAGPDQGPDQSPAIAIPAPVGAQQECRVQRVGVAVAMVLLEQPDGFEGLATAQARVSDQRPPQVVDAGRGVDCDQVAKRSATAAEPDRLSVVAARVGPRAKRVEFYALGVALLPVMAARRLRCGF